jgi:UDP:flavonoid glycosyltransferase YjiC (YdhE family)
VVADQQAFAGALTAERLGLPWATSATTTAEFTDPLAALPKVRAWVTERLDRLRHAVGDPAPRGCPQSSACPATPGTHSRRTGRTPEYDQYAGVRSARREHAPDAAGPALRADDATLRTPPGTDPRFSPRLTLAFSTPELAGTAEGVTWVGPSVAARPSPAGFPWEWLDPGRATVLVTLGTANTDVGGRFLDVCRAALRERADRVQAVLVDPGGTLGASGPDDKDLLVVPSVPQLALLEKGIDAVVCHAGHNTVCEALWFGVPLVVAPIRDDQPVVAAQVVDAGAGVRVRFGRVTAQKLGAALDDVLHEGGYRAAAERIGTAFRAAGGASAAATELEELARESR